MVSSVVLIGGAVMMQALYGHFPSVLDLLTAFGYIVLLSTAFAALSSFLLTFISSQGAYTTFSTIVGTLLGFLAGAYLPLGTLSATMDKVLNVLPFSPAAMLLRQPLATNALDGLAGGVGEIHEAVSAYYGMTLTVGSLTLSPALVILGLLAMAVVFTFLGLWRIGRTMR